MVELNLSGEWSLREDSKTEATPMTIPGDTISALLRAGVIDDPYVGCNELALRDIGQKEWILCRSFTVDDSLLACNHLYLELNFVDTFTTIFVNGKVAGETGNSFDRYRFEVKQLVNSGENRVEIHFHSAEREAKIRAEKLPFPIPYSGGDNNKIPHMNTIRKVQCHAGWDWGLTLMVSGLYETPFLRAIYDDFRLEYLTHEQCHQKEGAVAVDFTAHLFAYRECEAELLFSLGEEVLSVKTALKEGENSVNASLSLESPDLWWPAGYGEQSLYAAKVETAAGQVISQKIGLREIQVVNEKDSIGTSFLFRVNGVDIFAKGANWIPSDAMPLRQNAERERGLLEDAVAAHMNMVRVWGGGQYERESFYSSCDELGLLVWQDAMFSCSNYPSEEWFLDEVKRELSHQVRRLSHHPSLALWCGDNEVIGSLGWYPETKENPQTYLVNYDRLNRTVQTTIEALDQSRKFWPSSPCNGEMSYADGWHNDSSGDMHYWQVWHGGDDLESYYSIHPRFCSEFGFQSLPELATVATYAPPDQWNITSPVMEHHQKNSRGNSLIVEMMTRYFRMADGFERYLYLSQLQQAFAIKMGVEFWRSLRPTCMGTLYWQLNDNWPVASWSSIDYYGRWKQLHYHAKRFYAPLLVAARIDRETLTVSVVNDQLALFEGALTMELFSYNGELKKRRVDKVSIGGGAVTVAIETAVEEWTDAPTDHFFQFTLKRGEEEVASNTLFLAKFKSISLLDPKITTEVELAEEGRFQVRLSTENPAFFVTLLSKEGVIRLSDNSITLLPNRPITLLGEVTGELNSSGAIRESLSLFSLYQRESYSLNEEL